MGPAVFNTVEADIVGLAGSIPVRLRECCAAARQEGSRRASVVAPLSALASAGAVVALAAWRSSRLWARQGRLPPARRRPLPVAALLDALPVRRAAQLGALVVIGVGLAGPVVGAPRTLAALGIGWLAIVMASAVLGPVWPAISPLRLLPDRSTEAAPALRRAHRVGAWPAAVALAAIIAAATARPVPPTVLAGLVTTLVVTGGLVTWRLGGVGAERHDPAAAVCAVVAAVAPLGRGEAGWVLRSPVPALTQRQERPGQRAVLAVIAGAAATHLLAPLIAGWPGPGGAVGLAALAAAVGTAALAIRLAAFRSYLLPAVTAATAGWVLAHHAWLLLDATGVARPWPAIAGVAVLLVGHLVAVATGHRAALARFDPRAARAVQFPLRVVLALSAAAGAALLTS